MELECQHFGCDDKVKRYQLAEHEKCCDYRPDCNFCNVTLHETSHKVKIDQPYIISLHNYKISLIVTVNKMYSV